MKRATNITMLAMMIIVGVTLGWWIFTNFMVHIELNKLTGQLKLPTQLKVVTRATNNLGIGLDNRIDARVLMKQKLSIPLHGIYKANVTLDTVIPLEFVINYRNKVAVHSIAKVKGTTDLAFKNKLIPDYPLELNVPLDFEQPVNIDIPVKTQFRLHYEGPVEITLNQTVSPHVDAVLDTHLQIKRDTNTPIMAKFFVNAKIEQPQQSLKIELAKLSLPLSSLKLQRRSSGPALLDRTAD